MARKKSASFLHSLFVDEIALTACAGKGGDGCVSFRREKFVPRGGPDGGDGGKGGDVIVRTDESYKTLLHLTKRRVVKAKNGRNGAGKKRQGRRGADYIIPVPKGTSVFLEGRKVADLVEDGEEVVVAKGGKGGRGNAYFANSIQKAPRFAQKGEDGEICSVRLELILLADVGIIGFPNAGKSTLLSALSSANPKISSYPFTTLTPNLGLVRLNERDAFILADIPGIIPGAHSGKGLGDRFLKHLGRTKVLIHLLDGEDPDPAKKFYLLNSEMALFNNRFSEKPQIVALNKCDLDGVREKKEKIEREIKKEVLEISALKGEGLKELLSSISSFLAR
jgi:GTP-binding protein